MSSRSLAQIIKNPEKDNSVVLAVQYEGRESDFVDKLQELGGEILNTHSYNTISVRMEEEKIPSLRHIDTVRAVNMDNKYELAEEGN